MERIAGIKDLAKCLLVKQCLVCGNIWRIEVEDIHPYYLSQHVWYCPECKSAIPLKDEELMRYKKLTAR